MTMPTYVAPAAAKCTIVAQESWSKERMLACGRWVREGSTVCRWVLRFVAIPVSALTAKQARFSLCVAADTAVALPHIVSCRLNVCGCALSRSCKRQPHAISLPWPHVSEQKKKNELAHIFNQCGQCCCANPLAGVLPI